MIITIEINKLNNIIGAIQIMEIPCINTMCLKHLIKGNISIIGVENYDDLFNTNDKKIILQLVK